MSEASDLRREMAAGFAELRHEIRQLGTRLIFWIGGIVVATDAALFAALQLWPPHP